MIMFILGFIAGLATFYIVPKLRPMITWVITWLKGFRK